MEGSLSFLDELLGATTHDNGAGFGLRATSEEVIPFATHLPFFKLRARTKHVGLHAVDRRLDGAAACHHRTLQVRGVDAPGAENVPVRKPLRGYVADGKLAEDNFRAGVVDLLQL